MKRRAFDIYIAACIAGVLLVGIGVYSVGVILNRIDENKAAIARVRASVPAPVEAFDPKPLARQLAGQDAALYVCKMRTEWLRNVVETFVPAGDRVRIPDPPPGWSRWPTPKPEKPGNAEVE
jgi:hypothetical protein